MASARVPAPSASAAAQAAERMAALAAPRGALGQLEELAIWLAACQDQCPPRPPSNVRAVVLAGDHGVTAHGVSAYPREVTAAMVRAFHAGVAGVSVLAAQHQVSLRVLDIGVDADLSDLPGVSDHKVHRGSAPLHLADALTAAEFEQASAAGQTIAEQEIAAGADLLIIGDMGIGNTTPAAALIAAGLGLGAEDVTGIGTGLSETARLDKVALIDRALTRVGSRSTDPYERLTALGSADLAAAVFAMITAARAGVPILLDGVISVAEATVAEDLAPGTIAWCRAGHRSTEPAQSVALAKLGLTPILDLGMRLGEGSGAVAAVPIIRSAAVLAGEMALLADLG